MTKSYTPPGLDPSLKWNKIDPLNEIDIETVTWQIISRAKERQGEAVAEFDMDIEPAYFPVDTRPLSTTSKGKNKAAQKGLQSAGSAVVKSNRQNMNSASNGVDPHATFPLHESHLPRCKKRKASESTPDACTAITKRQRRETTSGDQPVIKHLPAPVWSDNSCAYDSLFSILWPLWLENKNVWTLASQRAPTMSFMGTLFTAVTQKTLEITRARDLYREHVVSQYPDLFTLGAFASIFDLVDVTLSVTVAQNRQCTLCGSYIEDYYTTRANNIFSQHNDFVYSTQDLACRYAPSRLASQVNVCENCLLGAEELGELPFVVTFEVREGGPNRSLPYINTHIYVPVGAAQQGYRLCGVIYYRDSHFVSRIIDSNRVAWFHDGLAPNLAQRSKYVFNKNLNAGNLDLTKARGYKAMYALYVRE
ncbi:hypothetical protein VNI00_013428 [Paramarasmius palmivorus]|uniref:USP domain-containing protein n=1 Tax=Paramarasmius palmivorus TaxID=297713 RepID=A0AAW0BZ03_9AGAR